MKPRRRLAGSEPRSTSSPLWPTGTSSSRSSTTRASYSGNARQPVAPGGGGAEWRRHRGVEGRQRHGGEREVGGGQPGPPPIHLPADQVVAVWLDTALGIAGRAGGIENGRLVVLGNLRRA